MSLIYFLDANALNHAILAGVRGTGWVPGMPPPNQAFRYLDELISGQGRWVINSVIRAEIADGLGQVPEAQLLLDTTS